MKEKLSFSVVLIGFLLLFLGGSIGLIISLKALNQINSLVDRDIEPISAVVVDIAVRSGGSERNVYLKVSGDETIERISLTKLLTLDINVGDNITVLKSTESERYVIVEYLSKIKTTYYLRIAILSVCIGLSYFFGDILFAIVKEIKGG
jgi:hypothetical protein